MKKIASASVATIASIALAGCTLKDFENGVGVAVQKTSAALSAAEAGISSSLPAVCSGIKTADLAFQSIVVTQEKTSKPVPQSVINDESIAIAAAAVPCANPTGSVANAASLIVTALATYEAIVSAIAATGN